MKPNRITTGEDKDELDKVKKVPTRGSRYERGDCDLCHSHDCHLIEGICGKCRGLYKLQEVQS